MDPADRLSDRIRRRAWPTLGVCLVLLALEGGALPRPLSPWVSNLLQLLLAAAAAVAGVGAAARERGLARWFFGLLALGTALWAVAQAILTLSGSLSPSRLLVAVQDLIFVGSTAPLVVACALRPDRPRPGALGLAADVGLVCLLTTFLHAYFAFAEQALGGPDVSPQSLIFFNPLRLMLLFGMLFLLHGSLPPWRRLYEELALAMVVLKGVGVLPNLALFSGAYRPGLADVAWTLPFLWVALAAREWRPPTTTRAPLAPEHEASWQAPAWRETRRGNVIALAAVALVPAVHQLATLAGAVAPGVARLRAQIALVATLLVGGLFLARQLHILRRAEVAQQEREHRFRALVENSADAIGLVDRDGRFSYLSASTARVTGHLPERLLGRSPLEFAHPEERERLERVLREVDERPGASARGFVRYRHADGSFRHGVIDAVNLRHAPAVGELVLHLRDVTEQRQAEQERARSLSLLEATLESTGDGIAVLGREGGATHFNRRLLELWSLPEGIVASRDGEAARRLVFDQLETPRLLLARVSELEAAPDRESFDTLELRDGRVLECYSLPQRLAGEVVGRVWSFRDVTERVRAEQAMARLVAIVEATPDFVLTCDGSLRPLYVNRAGRRMVGLADEQPLAELHIARFHPARAAARLLEEALPAALREGVWSGETRLRHRDGREIPVLQVVLAHRSPAGEVDFFSTIARDISERIHAEEQLRHSHTMAALGSLVAGVAHEVRNPLFAISSTIDAFEARLAGEPQQRHYVQVLRGELGRLIDLMNDLLEYAKPQRLELASGRIEDVVAQALAACRALADRCQVRLESALDADLPVLRFDPLRLGQVFRNLVENAVQHSPRGGRTRLAARLVREGGGAVECSVEDEGPGFAAEDLARVFEPFFSRRKGGTGLGLSIVQRIVSEHGGTIAAHNRPGGGARLTISLPLVAPREEHAP